MIPHTIVVPADLLRDLADTLADFCDHLYPLRANYPSEQLRYDRDMAPVLLARKLLARDTAP